MVCLGRGGVCEFEEDEKDAMCLFEKEKKRIVVFMCALGS